MLPAPHLDALRALHRLWPGECVVIGAAALRLMRPNTDWRVTEDIDVVVAVDLRELDRVHELGWVRDERRLHRWYLPSKMWVDLIPASISLRDRGELSWPDGQRMSLAGLDLAFAHAATVTVDGTLIRVAPLPVIFILKVIAYIDAPSRKRDLRDLTRILDIYIDDDDERRWSGDVPNDVDFDAASAWLLGQDISYIVGPAERRIIIAFCERALEVPLLLELQREAPRVWRVQEAPVERRLAAFQRALTVDRAAK